jgi:hypothetical protein
MPSLKDEEGDKIHPKGTFHGTKDISSHVCHSNGEKVDYFE